MPDIFTKEKRSEIMSKIRSTGSKMELRMKKALEENQIIFTYQPRMFGKPDFLVDENIIIFCDSSFWHGRDWNKLRHKLSNDYWYEHIKKNRIRDKKVNRELRNKGFIVLRFWDTQIKNQLSDCIDRINISLKGGELK